MGTAVLSAAQPEQVGVQDALDSVRNICCFHVLCANVLQLSKQGSIYILRDRAATQRTSSVPPK
jgi:hypothetical protein